MIFSIVTVICRCCCSDLLVPSTVSLSVVVSVSLAALGRSDMTQYVPSTLIRPRNLRDPSNNTAS